MKFVELLTYTSMWKNVQIEGCSALIFVCLMSQAMAISYWDYLVYISSPHFILSIKGMNSDKVDWHLHVYCLVHFIDVVWCTWFEIIVNLLNINQPLMYLHSNFMTFVTCWSYCFWIFSLDNSALCPFLIVKKEPSHEFNYSFFFLHYL